MIYAIGSCVVFTQKDKINLRYGTQRDIYVALAHFLQMSQTILCCFAAYVRLIRLSKPLHFREILHAVDREFDY